jgi:Ca2+-binding RTX toxin-like protein
MTKLTLYSTSSGKGFDMRSDWVSKVAVSDPADDPAYEVETATSNKAGFDTSNYALITYSTAVWNEAGQFYDTDASTHYTFKAVDAGKTIFSMTEINQTGVSIANYYEYYATNYAAANPTTQDMSKLIFYGLLQKADTITGTAYADYIRSWAGADTVNAGGGADTVLGGTGNDVLNGSSGNDILYGEAGKDRLAGGTGSDKFVFSTTLSASTNVDVIADFNVAADEIWLDNDVFTKAGAIGQLKSDAFHKGTAAADAEDRMIYNSSNGYLYYDRDGTGTAYSKVLVADLAAGLAMTYLDFEVIG